MNHKYKPSSKTISKEQEKALTKLNYAFARVINDISVDNDVWQYQIAEGIGYAEESLSKWKRCSDRMSIRALRLLILTQGLTDEQILSFLR